MNKLIKHRVGTEIYRGPEVSDREFYSIERADLFALGCTLFTILFQDIPFGNKVSYADFKLWFETSADEAKNKFYMAHQRKSEKQPSDAMLDLVLFLLHPDPLQRPSVEDALDNPWLRDVKSIPSKRIIKKLEAVMGFSEPPSQ